MLSDVTERRDMPGVFRDRLHRLADQLLAAGIIDPLERFDMGELVDAAYAHEIEEQVHLYRYFRVGGYYDLVDGSELIGTFRGVRLYFGPPDDRRPAQFDAWITHTDAGLEALSNPLQHVIGRIDGKRYVTAEGDEFELVETARIIESRDTDAIDDPDTYRTMLDLIELAIEQGDAERATALTERASVSIFMPCPACEDRFSRREDCAECVGMGFVRETPDRFRWRS
ncbi:hypothetical protein DN824_20405 [Stutzerimonas nosocomialis]|nr:hypothetical protein DN824_20405 [Stutzerimonas nosocomialis]